MRRLLLHKREITALHRHLAVRGNAAVPLSFYLKEGLVKVEIGFAQGKHEYDRRDDIKKRDSDREIKRVLNNKTQALGKELQSVKNKYSTCH